MPTGWRGRRSIRSSAPMSAGGPTGQGGSHRRRERYGHASKPRPQGPIIWIHAASVGETNAVLPLIRRILDYGVNVVLTTGTVTSAHLAEERAWRPRYPSICAARPETGGEPLPRPLGARPRHNRRIRDLADDDPRTRRAPHSAGSGQRPPFGPLVQIVEEAAECGRGAVRESGPCGGAIRTRRRTIPDPGRPAGDRVGQSEGRHAASGRR